MIIQIPGVFSSDGLKYYTASYGSKFYTNQASPNDYHSFGTLIQPFIFSSDVSNAAYTMSTAFSKIATLSVTLNGLTS